MELKKWIREARKAKAWTQTQLGDALGLTKQNISGWETGRHEPSYAQMLKISELTGHPISEGNVGTLVVAESSAPYSEQLTLSPAERDLILALRKLPDPEQLETTRDVMHRAEVIEQVVQREFARRGISISSYVSATRAAETLPPPPAAAPTKNRREVALGRTPERRDPRNQWVPSPLVMTGREPQNLDRKDDDQAQAEGNAP